MNGIEWIGFRMNDELCLLQISKSLKLILSNSYIKNLRSFKLAYEAINAEENFLSPAHAFSLLWRYHFICVK